MMIVTTFIAASIAAQATPVPQSMAAPAQTAEKKMACCEKMAKGGGCACCKDMAKEGGGSEAMKHGDAGKHRL